MPSVETVIVALWIALLLLVASTPVLVGYEWGRARDPQPRQKLRARYRRGRHHARPPLLARVADAYLSGARDMAAAHALLKGVPL